MSFYDLNVDCLLNLFKYCDDKQTLPQLAESCQKFQEILHNNVFLKREKLTLVFEENLLTNASMQHTYANSCIRSYGPYVNELEFQWKYVLCTMDEKKSSGLLRMLGQYVGENIRVLNLCGIIVTDELLPIIQPILLRLHTLKNFSYKGNNDASLQVLCPNLWKLKMHNANNCIKLIPDVAWSSLKSLSIERAKVEFLQQNPQIENLNLIWCPPSIITSASKYLPNLRKMSFIAEHGLSYKIFQDLGRFLNLTKLGLYEVSPWDCLRLSGLSQIANLRELKLSVSGAKVIWQSDISRKIASLPVEVPYLEIVHIIRFGIEMMAVITFVNFAKHLKELHLINCNTVVVEPLFLHAVAQARKYDMESSPAKKLPLQLVISGCKIARAKYQVYLETIAKYVMLLDPEDNQ